MKIRHQVYYFRTMPWSMTYGEFLNSINAANLARHALGNEQTS